MHMRCSVVPTGSKVIAVRVLKHVVRLQRASTIVERDNKIECLISSQYNFFKKKHFHARCGTLNTFALASKTCCRAPIVIIVFVVVVVVADCARRRWVCRRPWHFHSDTMFPARQLRPLHRTCSFIFHAKPCNLAFHRLKRVSHYMHILPFPKVLPRRRWLCFGATFVSLFL